MCSTYFVRVSVTDWGLSSSQSALDLVNEETFTPVWYAIQFAGSNEFAIVDFFENEEGREKHLGGKVASALLSTSAAELLDGSPNISKITTLAAKV